MLKVAIITNITKDNHGKMAVRVADIASQGADCYMIEDCKINSNAKINYVPEDEIFKICDVAIVIGGDGTLLRVAPMCAKNNVPAVGINLGTVGFLTEVEESEVEEAIRRVLAGDYIKESRMLLKVKINDDEPSYHALNDLVVSKPDGIKLLDFDLYRGDELVYHYRADGLVIATPTGSTGYSISAGGPVVDPNMSLYIATPICAHMLSIRSAVLSAEKEIKVHITHDTAIISTDGQRQRLVSPEDMVVISKSNYTFELIKLGDSNFYNTLMQKLS